MSLLDQLKQKAAEKEIAGKHPLLAMKVDRDVCDAYFMGIVVAALVDDNKIDATERKYISKMGVGLGLPETEIEDELSRVAKIMGDEDAQGKLVQEIAGVIKDSAVAKLFLAEFSLIWASHTSDLAQLHEWRNVLASLMSLKLPENWFSLLDAAIADTPDRVKAIAQISDFDSTTITYLFGDVTKAVAEVRKAETEAAKRQKEISAQKASLKNLEEHLCKLVESERPIKIEEVRKLVDAAGIKEHQVTTVLKLLLPYARKEFNAFIADIPNLESTSDSTDRTVMVAKSIHGRRLQRHISLFDILTTNAKEYSVMFEPKKEEFKKKGIFSLIHDDEFNDGRDAISNGHGRASFNKFAWSWRSSNGEREARQAVKELFDRALSEFEFRATF